MGNIRFDFVAVCYSVAAVMCVALGVLALRGRQPRVLGCGTIALWLLAAFVLLFGAGMPQPCYCHHFLVRTCRTCRENRAASRDCIMACHPDGMASQ